MQPAISALLELGSLPSSATASAPKVHAYEEQFAKIKTPITNEEAFALVKLFGPDDCFGLAWTLLHLLETAPGWPLQVALDSIGGEWKTRLLERTDQRDQMGQQN